MSGHELALYPPQQTACDLRAIAGLSGEVLGSHSHNSNICVGSHTSDHDLALRSDKMFLTRVPLCAVCTSHTAQEQTAVHLPCCQYTAGGLCMCWGAGLVCEYCNAYLCLCMGSYACAWIGKGSA
jgi:hypothetical protein